MDKTILWIEDDYHAIKGLFRPLEQAGITVDVTTSAVDAYTAITTRKRPYDLIVVDVILPISNDDRDVLEPVKAWENEDYVGLGIAKWLAWQPDITCPILILSVVQDLLTTYQLESYDLKYSLCKSGLLPSVVKQEIYNIWGIPYE